MEPLQQEPAAEGWLKEKSDVLMLLRLREQLKQQLLEYSTAVGAGQENDIEHIDEEQDFKSATQDLEEDIKEVKVSFQNKTSALQRIQLMAALRNKVNQNDDDSRLIVQMMKQILTLSQAVIEQQQQLREAEQKLMDIKCKRLSLKKAEGCKVLQIHTTMKKQKEEEAKKVAKNTKMHNELQKERDITTVIQNVFQMIIMGSRVNWAEDPPLKAVVLQLEKNIL